MPKRRQSALERERSSSSNARAVAILCESSESDHNETNERSSYSRRRTQRLTAALRKQFQSRGNAALRQSIEETLTRHGPPCKRPRSTSATTTELALSCPPHAVRTPKACQVSIIALSNPSSLTEQCVIPLPVVRPQRPRICTLHGNKQNKRTTTTTTAVGHPLPDPHSVPEQNPHKDHNTRPMNEDDNNGDEDLCDDTFEPLSDAFLSQPPPLPNGQLSSSLCGTAQLVTECLQQRRWNLQYNASIAAVAGSSSSQLNDGVPFDNHYLHQQHQGSPTVVAMQNTATRGAKEKEEEEVHSPSVAALGSPFHEGADLVDHHRTPSAQSTTSKATSMECLSSPLWSATALMRRSTSLMELSRSQRRRGSTTSRRLLSEWSVHDQEDDDDDDDDGEGDDTAEDAGGGVGGRDDQTTTTKVLSSTKKVEGERQQAMSMLESSNGLCEEVRQAIADAAWSHSRPNPPPPSASTVATMMMVSPYKCRERSDIWATILEHCSSSKKKRKAEQQEQQWETNGAPVGNRVEEVQAAAGTQEGAACRRALFPAEEMGGANTDLDDVPIATTSRPCVSAFCRPLTYDDEEGGGGEERRAFMNHVSPQVGEENGSNAEFQSLPSQEYRRRVGDDDDPRGPSSSACGSFLAPTFAVYLFEGSNNSTQQSQPHTQASSPLQPEGGGGGGVQSQTAEQDTCPASALLQPSSFFVKDLQSIANECALSCSQMWSQQVWTATATELSQHHAEEEEGHQDDVQHRKTTPGDTPFASTLLSGGRVDVTEDSQPSSAGRHHDDKKRDSLSMRNANLLLDQRISMLLDSVLTH